MPTSNPSGRELLICAGEASGDLLGAELFCALRQRHSELEAFGVTGPQMDQAGVQSIGSIQDFGIMGFTEVFQALPRIKNLAAAILSECDRRQPKFAVLIDNQGFSQRLGEQLKLRGVFVYLYVAPQLWAWGEYRVHHLKKCVDHILGILPFETEFFRKYDIPYDYVGSPIMDRVASVERGEPRDPGRPVIGLFPGSRNTEFRLIAPDLLEVAKRLRAKRPHWRFRFNVAKTVSVNRHPQIMAALSQMPWVEVTEGQSMQMMADVDFAMIASGTATLECALIGTPLAVIYRVKSMNYQISKRVIRIPYLSLPNLIFGKKVVEEYYQSFSLHEIEETILKTVEDPTNSLKNQLAQLRQILTPRASAKAADKILFLLK